MTESDETRRLFDDELLAKPDRPPASKWKEYAMLPRRCTVCGDPDIVLDGCYLCPTHHLEVMGPQ